MHCQFRADELLTEHRALMQSAGGAFVSRLLFCYYRNHVDVLAAHCGVVASLSSTAPTVDLCRRVLAGRLRSSRLACLQYWD